MITTTQENISLRSVLRPLQFVKGDNLPFYDDVHNNFCALLHQKWSEQKGEGSAAVFALAAQLKDVELENYLVQPEVAHHLLQADLYDGDENAAFFLRTLMAHQARSRHSYDKDQYDLLWSANGDYLISYYPPAKSFEEYEAPMVAERIPLDFFSPYCQALTQEFVQASADTIITLYDMDEAERILEHMDAAVAPLAAYPNLHELICRFNKIVLVKKQVDPGGGIPFISGSDAHYIGRTHVMNPETVGPEKIAEMFVHEAIHTILFIIEESTPWMPRNSDPARTGVKIPSNWSGNQLSIYSYFQAIFVWFGIWNHWRHAYVENLYDREWILKRLGYIENGFSTLDPEAVKKTYDLQVPQETIDTIQEAKKIVMRS